MLSLAATVEPLRMANRMSGKPLYEWLLYTAGNEVVCASNGMDFSPTRRMDEHRDIDTMIVVAGIGAHVYDDESTKQWLRALSSSGINIGATSTGSLLLARFGLLKDQTCTIHWENIDSFREAFPRLNVTGELYEIDGKYLTCSGGLAGLDMMLYLIGSRHGEKLVHAVAEQCIHPNIRPAHESQRMSLQAKFHVNNPRLVRAIEVMREHLDEQLSCKQIAKAANLSSRQMERLFKEHLATTPNHFYLDLRLDRARFLLVQSSLPIVEIASICGFGSTSYFAKCYRERFGHLPREERGRTEPL
ncbi:GlxA family transcriptional regulator [Zestomonas carbonaria]|uniref:HTH-type transcriptional regulator CdhR n=1 Tax=Zestomonas carbonaria TaxID=2762745 RepID=A0A7U7EKY9_9GAMM|nr:GlxA family transcriptional regulator [Pseudomonas carbonaria]CAD5106924.1 HTH-type transcriptional regulator CdhR [Pseudomonas carbonaria]